MTANEGTTLYLQVEQALKDFQTGVTKLQSQQAETEILRLKNDEALKQLVGLLAQAENVRAQLEAKVRLLAEFRLALTQENAEFTNSTKAEIKRLREDESKARASLQTEVECRQQQLTGQVKRIESATQSELQGMQATLNYSLEQLEQWASRQRSSERKQKITLWAIGGLLLLVVVSMLL